MERPIYDVIIVGGGAAGLSAALVLGRARRKVAVIDAGEPRNAPAAHMQGYLSRDGLPPAQLVEIGRSEISGYGVEVIADRVVGITEGFSVAQQEGPTLQTRRVLLALGVGDDIPDVPGLRDRWGRDVLHCPYCHGWEVRDQPLGVLGAHPGAVLHAQLIRQWSDDVVLFEHTLELSDKDREELGARGIRVVPGVVSGLAVEDDALRGVRLADGSVEPRAALFIRPVNALHPDGLAASLGCEFTSEGFVRVDATGRTSVPGVWAAGNVVDPRAQVITAAGAGSAAAIAINADLLHDDIAARVHAIRTGTPMKNEVH